MIAEGGLGSVLNAAGQVVVQVEEGGGGLLIFRKMDGLLGVFEEDMRLRTRGVEVEETEIEVVHVDAVEVKLAIDGVQVGRETVGGGETVVAVGLAGVGHEYGDFADQEGSWQAVDDGAEQCVPGQFRS